MKELPPGLPSKQEVLDIGYISLIDYMGTDETIIESARMSTNKGFEGWGTPEKPGDEKLLEYLYKNRHTSPFEMCELVVEVKAPIMVFREWHRHRTQSYNELSARYSVMPDEHYIPSSDRVQAQSKKNKQSSEGNIPDKVKDQFRINTLKHQAMLYDAYADAIDDGIARELARVNTPISRYSKMRAKANLANWLHFLKLRMAEGAQWEIRQYANAIAVIIKHLWPRTYALFEEYTLYAKTFSRTELAKLDETLTKYVS